jgi:hypothetical protein
MKGFPLTCSRFAGKGSFDYLSRMQHFGSVLIVAESHPSVASSISAVVRHITNVTSWLNDARTFVKILEIKPNTGSYRDIWGESSNGIKSIHH